MTDFTEMSRRPDGVGIESPLCRYFQEFFNSELFFNESRSKTAWRQLISFSAFPGAKSFLLFERCTKCNSTAVERRHTVTSKSFIKCVRPFYMQHTEKKMPYFVINIMLINCISVQLHLIKFIILVTSFFICLSQDFVCFFLLLSAEQELWTTTALFDMQWWFYFTSISIRWRYRLDDHLVFSENYDKCDILIWSFFIIDIEKILRITWLGTTYWSTWIIYCENSCKKSVKTLHLLVIKRRWWLVCIISDRTSRPLSIIQIYSDVIFQLIKWRTPLHFALRQVIMQFWGDNVFRLSKIQHGEWWSHWISK